MISQVELFSLWVVICLQFLVDFEDLLVLGNLFVEHLLHMLVDAFLVIEHVLDVLIELELLRELF